MVKKVYGLYLCRDTDDDVEVIPNAILCHQGEVTNESLIADVEQSEEFSKNGAECKGNENWLITQHSSLVLHNLI